MTILCTYIDYVFMPAFDIKNSLSLGCHNIIQCPPTERKKLFSLRDIFPMFVIILDSLFYLLLIRIYFYQCYSCQHIYKFTI